MRDAAFGGIDRAAKRVDRSSDRQSVVLRRPSEPCRERAEQPALWIEVIRARNLTLQAPRALADMDRVLSEDGGAYYC